jgi:tRNA dimethylallyltransferase
MIHKSNQKYLLVIAGPTAVGKTDFAIQLAKHFKTEIVSADSRQFYREMSIGTAKPSNDELVAVTHHFINSHSIADTITAGDYEKQALALLDDLFKIHDIVVLAGGSGLFIKAVCEGFDELPVSDPILRERLNEEFLVTGIKGLQEKLKTVDPEYFDLVDSNNPQRIIRALEVFEITGFPFSALRKSSLKQRQFKTVKIGLNLPREKLYERINNRVDIMLQEGLLDEARGLLPFRHLNALNTVGYSELFDFFDGKTDLSFSIELIKQNTRRFAKRQLTWFRRDAGIRWIEADKPILNFDQWLNEVLPAPDNTTVQRD